MAEVRDLLEDVRRQVRPRPGALDRIHGRHRRKEQRRRIATASLAVVVAIAGVFAITQTLRFGDRGVPAAPPIDPSNVARLLPTWSVAVPGGGATAPVTADGIVYVTSTTGSLYAIDGRSGETLWAGAIPTGVATSPAVSDGSVFVEAAGTLVAFDTRCGDGGAACSPRWTAPTGGANLASPTVAGGSVFVAAFPGGVFSYPIDCADPCTPTWVAADEAGHMAHPPAVSHGVVWDSSDHRLSAYPTMCTEACSPIVAGVRPGAPLSSGPTVDDGTLYVGASDGSVVVIPTSCAAGGSCSPRWAGSTAGSIVAAPVVADGLVFVGSTDGRVTAFPTTCGPGVCRARWTGRTGGPIDQSPLVVNGLVYAPSTDGTVTVFPEVCAAVCRPVFTITPGALPSTPAVWADSAIYVTSADGTLTAYTVGGGHI
jgi:outer membrane protein assembly factor BamB